MFQAGSNSRISDSRPLLRPLPLPQNSASGSTNEPARLAVPASSGSGFKRTCSLPASLELDTHKLDQAFEQIDKTPSLVLRLRSASLPEISPLRRYRQALASLEPQGSAQASQTESGSGLGPAQVPGAGLPHQPDSGPYTPSVDARRVVPEPLENGGIKGLSERDKQAICDTAHQAIGDGSRIPEDVVSLFEIKDGRALLQNLLAHDWVRQSLISVVYQSFEQTLGPDAMYRQRALYSPELFGVKGECGQVSYALNCLLNHLIARCGSEEQQDIIPALTCKANRNESHFWLTYQDPMGQRTCIDPTWRQFQMTQEESKKDFSAFSHDNQARILKADMIFIGPPEAHEKLLNYLPPPMGTRIARLGYPVRDNPATACIPQQVKQGLSSALLTALENIPDEIDSLFQLGHEPTLISRLVQHDWVKQTLAGTVFQVLEAQHTQLYPYRSDFHPEVFGYVEKYAQSELPMSAPAAYALHYLLNHLITRCGSTPQQKILNRLEFSGADDKSRFWIDYKDPANKAYILDPAWRHVHVPEDDRMKAFARLPHSVQQKILASEMIFFGLRH